MSLNFMVSYSAAEGTQPKEIGVEFSNDAIGVESGQPVFTKDTRIWILNPTNAKVKLYLNEEEKEVSEDRIELDQLEEGTYTLIIISTPENQGTPSEATYGFTIQ